jgi:hypothetical protein
MNKPKGKQMNIGKGPIAGSRGKGGAAPPGGAGEPVFTIDTIIEVLSVLGYKNPNQGQAPGKNQPQPSGGGGGDELQKLLSMLNG